MLFNIILPVEEDLKTCSKYVVREVPIQSKRESTPNPPLGAGPCCMGEAMLPQMPDLGMAAFIAGYVIDLHSVDVKVHAGRGYFNLTDIFVWSAVQASR